MNIKTTKNLIALFALAFLVAGINQASAYVPGVWDPQPRIPNNEPAFYKVPTTYDAPMVSQGATTYTYTTTPAPKTVVTTTTPPVRNTTTNSNNTSSNSVNNNNNNDSRELKPVIIDNGPSNNNGLTALSLQGSGSFMPSSIWQWLLVIFLILVVIIISRMLSKSHTHEVHTVKAH